MKKFVIVLIIVLSLAAVSAIALPGTSALHRASNSLWDAIKVGTAMEPGGTSP